jgi:hypothetical protein
MSQVVKYTPKTLYSGYSLLTISEILDEEQNTQSNINVENKTQLSSETLPIENKPFKISQRKMLRTSKR